MVVEIADGAVERQSERPLTLAVWKTMLAAPATSSTAHTDGNTRLKRRRKPSAASESTRPSSRTAGVHTNARRTTAPISARRAANQTNRTTPKPHPTTRPAPVSSFTDLAEIVDGAP